jgi:hypothetical protein
MEIDESTYQEMVGVKGDLIKLKSLIVFIVCG